MTEQKEEKIGTFTMYPSKEDAKSDFAIYFKLLVGKKITKHKAYMMPREDEVDGAHWGGIRREMECVDEVEDKWVDPDLEAWKAEKEGKPVKQKAKSDKPKDYFKLLPRDKDADTDFLVYVDIGMKRFKAYLKLSDFAKKDGNTSWWGFARKLTWDDDINDGDGGWVDKKYEEWLEERNAEKAAKEANVASPDKKLEDLATEDDDDSIQF